MKELVVISGKGGTGKTSLAASLVALDHKAVVVDCDVDAPDLHLVLQPVIMQKELFIGGQTARINAPECTACEQCLEVCRFEAIRCNGPVEGVNRPVCSVDPLACEGCAVCAAICPAQAIEMVAAVNGEWFISHTRFGLMVHARLGIAEDNSGKLVSLLRKRARELAEQGGHELIICDGPPGIGCPVIASLTGASLVLIVTEPTVSALHDFERVVELARHFNLPAVACINKFDLNQTMAERVASRAGQSGVEVLGRIPYDKAVTEAQMQSVSVVEYDRGPASAAIIAVWEQVRDRLESVAPARAAGSPA